MATALYLVEGSDIGRYETAFDHLRGEALDVEASRRHIRDMIKECAQRRRRLTSPARLVKSDLSNGGDNCLEVAFVDGVAAVRDSVDVGDPEAKVLVISWADYRAFTGGVARGRENLLLP